MTRIRRVLLMMSLMIAGSAAWFAAKAFIPSIGGALRANVFIDYSFMELLYIFPALPLYMIITRQKPADVIPLAPLGWKNAGFIVIMAVLTDPVLKLLSAFTSLFYPNAAAEITSGITAYNMPAAFIGITIAPAIAEEICIRGAVLSALRGIGVKRAVIVNGIIFGLMHLNPQQIPYAMFMGIIFALYVVYTHSVFSSMLAHFLANASSLVLSLLMPRDRSISLSVLLTAALVSFLCFLIVFKRFRSYNLSRILSD